MTRRQWATGLLGVVVVAGSATLVPTATTAATTAAATPTVAKSADSTLGNGLGRLLTQSERRSRLKKSAGLRIDQEALAIRDDRNRVLVQLTPQAGVNRAAFRAQAEKLGLAVQNTDKKVGTLEGFTPLSAVRALAALPGTGTIAQALKPKTNVGAATSQGVALQRVDKVQARGIDGRGITIGALSDSFDTAAFSVATGDPLTVHAAQDVKSGDLPGKGNKQNRRPVVVIQDSDSPDSDTDEGRAMLQIAHDVAPGSKLCFATANGGLLNFAANVRKLADPKGRCGADVVVDDVIYFDEPMFSDSPLSDAIDDVAAKGTNYFTSAGNEGEQQSWNSRVKLIPAEKGLKGTNLDFTDVDPALYDGGLQDMDPGRGTDVAQDLKIDPATGGILDLQWDDPVDANGPTIGAPYLSTGGELTAATPAQSFTFTPTADQVGKTVQILTDAIPSGETDLVLSVTAPDGTDLGTIDTGTSPEVLVTTLAQAGTYTITISGFESDTGDFTLTVSPVLAPSTVTTDFNVLIFDAAGAYLGALADQNTLSGRPSEVADLSGLADIQIVVSRADTGPFAATRIRNVLTGHAYFTEYADPLSQAIFGHATAKGATAVAAYDPFRSYLPEAYTSPGGVSPVFFDSAGNRYAKPQIRRTPQVAATDRGNTTFFVADDARDADALPNFGGTSASAPHAAAIAALALQKAGGPGSYTPAALRARLERSTFTHDLDPMTSSGSSGGLTVTAQGNQGREIDLVPGSMNDPNFFRVYYTGRVPLRSITFLGETASPTALGVRRPGESDGIVFDPRPFGNDPDYRSHGFPFTIGSTSGGLSTANVAASFSVPGGGQSAPGQFRHLTLRFTQPLIPGQGLSFGVDRDLAISGFGGSNEGNGADELGGATFLPSGRAVSQGMQFVAVRADGSRILGVLRNRLGSGYSPVDGFGVINAEKAVLGR